MPQQFIAYYFRAAYAQVRKFSPADTANTIDFWLHDAFTDYTTWNNTFTAPHFKQVVMDSHHYEVFDPETMGKSAEYHIGSVCKKGKNAAAFSAHNYPVVFGEWCGALTDCTKHRNIN
jgi:glucan 1,3-beta-glucosidase